MPIELLGHLIGMIQLTRTQQFVIRPEVPPEIEKNLQLYELGHRVAMESVMLLAHEFSQYDFPIQADAEMVLKMATTIMNQKEDEMLKRVASGAGIPVC